MYDKNGLTYCDSGQPFPPCFHCQYRNEDCHANCKRYKAYRIAVSKYRYQEKVRKAGE